MSVFGLPPDRTRGFGTRSSIGTGFTLGSLLIRSRFTLDSLLIRSRIVLGSLSVHSGFALDSLWIHSRFTLDSPSIHSRFTLDLLSIHPRFTLSVRCELCRMPQRQQQQRQQQQQQRRHSHGLMAATTRRSPSRLTSPLWVSDTCCKRTSPPPLASERAGRAVGWLLFVFGVRYSFSPQVNWGCEKLN